MSINWARLIAIDEIQKSNCFLVEAGVNKLGTTCNFTVAYVFLNSTKYIAYLLL